MTKEELEKLYSEDAEVKTFVDAIADQRVNQARENWLKKQPAEIEKRANEILEKKEAETARRVELENRFIAIGIPPEMGFSVLGEFGSLDDKSLKSRFAEVEKQFIGYREQMIKEKYKNNPTPKRSTSEPDSLPPLKDASSKEILANLKEYSEVN